jgi:hypothetical protein
VHAFHPDLRRLLVAAGAACLLMLAALTLTTAAGELELRRDGGSEAAPATASAPTVRRAPAQPRWVARPLSPPAFSIR